MEKKQSTWQERFDEKFVVKEENGLSKFKQEIIDRPYLIKDFIASEREALLREIKSKECNCGAAHENYCNVFDSFDRKVFIFGSEEVAVGIMGEKSTSTFEPKKHKS